MYRVIEFSRSSLHIFVFMNIMYVHALLPVHAPTRPSKRYLLLQWNDV